MQALFILPLLMSVVDFIMLSAVHAIMAAEAGVKAKAESMAAAINVLI